MKLWTQFSAGEKLHLLKSRFENQASICIDYYRAQCGIIGENELWLRGSNPLYVQSPFLCTLKSLDYLKAFLLLVILHRLFTPLIKLLAKQSDFHTQVV